MCFLQSVSTWALQPKYTDSHRVIYAFYCPELCIKVCRCIEIVLMYAYLCVSKSESSWTQRAAEAGGNT